MMKRKGFTLVELLVVIVIISILGIIVIAVLNPEKLITRTKDTVLNYHLRTFGYVVDSLHSADNAYPTLNDLLSNLKNANPVGPNGFSFPVKTGTLSTFSYVVSSDGAVSCLSTATDDGRNLLWCSNAGDIKDSADPSIWCYPKNDGHGNILAGGC